MDEFGDDNFQGADENETFGADEFDQDEVDGGAREDVRIPIHITFFF